MCIVSDDNMGYETTIFRTSSIHLESGVGFSMRFVRCSHSWRRSKLANTFGIVGDRESLSQLGSLLDSSQPFDKAVKETLRTVEVALGYITSDPKSNKVKDLSRQMRDVTCWRDVFDILHLLPRTLEDVYELTFQRIREQGKRKKELACRTLALVALALWLLRAAAVCERKQV